MQLIYAHDDSGGAAAVYALDDAGARSLYERATRSLVLEAHEYVLPQRFLQQWTAPEMQEFLKRMAPRRQYR